MVQININRLSKYLLIFLLLKLGLDNGLQDKLT